MCGILGILSTDSFDDIDTLVSNALSTLHHRGPDDSGVWCNLSKEVALGHTRLSILDLTSAGHQPMSSISGRYQIVFNGEIYNHLDLRNKLEKNGDSLSWAGHSDTETILRCIDCWGIEKTLKSMVGMFAITLWDEQDRKLILARDRFGEKPLYYGYMSGKFVVASELKAIKAMPLFHAEIDRNALANYMRYLYVPASQCIYKGLNKLEAGTWMEVQLDLVKDQVIPKANIYWSALEESILGRENIIQFSSDKEAVDQLELLLNQSISEHMLSDVPLGTFLSGGIDSSTVAAIMQSQSNRPIQTFSIGFDEDGYNEAKYAKAISQHLGTDHTELYVQSHDAINVIPNLSTIYDEPFADSSQIPTFLVSQLAKKDVTVALSGDGGDELFGGYNRYFIANGSWKKIENIPINIRKFMANAINSISQSKWDAIYKSIEILIPKHYRIQLPGDKIHKIASILICSNMSQLYHRLTRLWDPSNLVIGATKINSIDMGRYVPIDSVSEMMVADAMNYLVDDILVKVDRAAMAVSLETRVPLLDHRIYEFASRLPFNYKMRDNVGKWILKEVLYKHVPKEMLERPKMGFSIPLHNWLRGPLRDWSEDLLDEARLNREGYFNSTEIRQKWNEHLSGKKDWGIHLWGVLMFEAWLESNKL